MLSALTHAPCARSEALAVANSRGIGAEGSSTTNPPDDCGEDGSVRGITTCWSEATPALCRGTPHLRMLQNIRSAKFTLPQAVHCQS
mmetsp:Transcript_10576/g.37137  ORF Transcript_10576/g.37137 Transcript_10576/m.37137 type:complete len:87 (+) Transcript_10576:508-768(+)